MNRRVIPQVALGEQNMNMTIPIIIPDVDTGERNMLAGDLNRHSKAN